MKKTLVLVGMLLVWQVVIGYGGLILVNQLSSMPNCNDGNIGSLYCRSGIRYSNTKSNFMLYTTILAFLVLPPVIAKVTFNKLLKWEASWRRVFITQVSLVALEVAAFYIVARLTYHPCGCGPV